MELCICRVLELMLSVTYIIKSGALYIYGSKGVFMNGFERMVIYYSVPTSS